MNKKNKILLFFILISIFIVSFIWGVVKPVIAVNLISFRYVYNATCPTVTGSTLRGVRGNSTSAKYVSSNCAANKYCICFYSEI